MCLSRSETACAFWARGCPQPGSPHCRVGGHDIERPGCMPAVTICSDCGDTTCSDLSLDVVTRFEAYITNGVSRLQTNELNSTCRPSCHGHTLPPRWSKACHPARYGGVYDHHHRVYHGLILSG